MVACLIAPVREGRADFSAFRLLISRRNEVRVVWDDAECSTASHAPLRAIARLTERVRDLQPDLRIRSPRWVSEERLRVINADPSSRHLTSGSPCCRTAGSSSIAGER